MTTGRINQVATMHLRMHSCAKARRTLLQDVRHVLVYRELREQRSLLVCGNRVTSDNRDVLPRHYNGGYVSLSPFRWLPERPNVSESMASQGCTVLWLCCRRRNESQALASQNPDIQISLQPLTGRAFSHDALLVSTHHELAKHSQASGPTRWD